MDDFATHFESQLGAMVWTLSGLIEAETPTSAKSAIDELVGWLQTWAEDLGAVTTIHEQTAVGNFLECRWNADLPTPPILILCHLDTVHPLGTLDARPAYTEGDYLYGPGSYDMKGGITIAQTVLQELVKYQRLPQRPIILFFNSDEEIGSPHSRSHIEQVAQGTALALVMEPAPAPNTVVTERKGVGIFQMVALGKAAHSGSNPDDGVNAIEEIAHQIGKVSALSDRTLGTTVIPTIIHGGTTHNVIPDECDITINVRVRYQYEADRVLTSLNNLSNEAYLPEALLYITGGFTRPPMEHNTLMEQTVATARRVVPLPIEEFSKGGGSDGNFTAAMGIPTLDGLGPLGGGAHSEDERVFIPSLVDRATLLAYLICNWP
ncbi:MAG: M20/M25/M40 family metallo-hydrolase [Anaerolineales bacterium]|nr:M20/M25/M40 family metallo-hydrolase [Anaerolineales bacterium]